MPSLIDSSFPIERNPQEAPSQHHTPAVSAMSVMQIKIGAMSCASCAGRLEQALSTLPRVKHATVNFATELATIQSEDGMSATENDALYAQVVRQIRQLGFLPLSDIEADTGAASHVDNSENSLARRWRFAWQDYGPVVLALALALPLVLPMLAMLWGAVLTLPIWLQMALAAPVQFWLGARFYRSAWAAIRAGAANMDVLVILGTSAAWGLSLWLWGRHLQAGGDFWGVLRTEPHVYFESAAVVMALLLLGKWLEARVKKRTHFALSALAALRPERAHLVLTIEKNGVRQDAEHDVSPAELMVGDIVRVRPGERIPADGIVLDGASEVDESLLTGESLPVSKSKGELVTGGALNGQGVLTLEVRAVGAKSVLAQIVALVQSAQAEKAPVEALVDKVARVFVPGVLLLAALTFLTWWGVLGWTQDGLAQAILHAVSVLVIACPCALGLATPAALIVGTGVAARQGILFKGAASLERASQIHTVALDKTGTLTLGQPELVSLRALVYSVMQAVDIEDSHPSAPNAVDIHWLGAIGALHGPSSHPLAQATRHYLAQQGHVLSSSATHVQELSGKGVQGQWHHWEWALGSVDWMVELGAWPDGVRYTFGSSLQNWLDTMAQQGASVSALARRPLHNADAPPSPWQLCAVLAFADAPKPQAAQAVQDLRDAGCQVAILSGDNRAAVEHLAREIGLQAQDSMIAYGLCPRDKAEKIKSLQKDLRLTLIEGLEGGQFEGHTGVAMVGDGMNDAPALAQADVGMAFFDATHGSDMAAQAADITLMHSSPRLIARALHIARATTRTIRQNLFWAFLYNIIGLPLAALGYLNPMVAGAAMALSSICVVLNALALRRKFEV